MATKKKQKLNTIDDNKDDITTINNQSLSTLPKVIIEDGKLTLVIKKGSSLSELYGTKDHHMFHLLINQVASVMADKPSEENKWLIDGSIAMFEGIKPKDEVESLLAAQMIATHNISMEMSKRAMLREQTCEGVDLNINRVTKLMRTFTAQVEALKRYRSTGKQTIQVQHVNVNDGGQAVVGDIVGGGCNG